MLSHQALGAPSLSRRQAVLLAVAAAAAGRPDPSAAATAAELTADSRVALERLYASRPQTREWGRTAKAILVFPKIVKAGVMIGGQGGEGVLLVNDEVVGFFRIAAASFGLQLGAQTFSYALFFMTQDAVDYVESSNGWSIGSGPSVVVVDEGAAKTLNTTSMRKDVYAVPFGQQGLMAGLGLEGSKISRIKPKG